MNKLVKWSKREYSLSQRILATGLAGVFFLILIPALLIIVLPKLDIILGFSSLSFGIINIVVGGIIVIIGGFYALWSIISQITRARGTPLPVMPTQKLLVDGPFKHCRNPMAFGAIFAYFGLSIIVGSLSSIFLVLIFLVLLILWIKKVEEEELEIRFGQDYVDYKKTTPFMIPKPWRK